jgi:hypothetical protein
MTEALVISIQKGSVRASCRKNGIKTFDNNEGSRVTTPAELDRALFPELESEPDWSAFDDKKAKQYSYFSSGPTRSKEFSDEKQTATIFPWHSTRVNEWRLRGM